jgi:23S rRNA (pseudouridine1915-N3)-methyltransferase
VGGLERAQPEGKLIVPMRLVVAAVGRLKDGPERELAERYRKRSAQVGRRIGFRDTEIIEIRESRAQEAAKRVAEESVALANLIAEKAVTIVLDERGENIDSATLAQRLGRWRDDGRPAAVFVIGGDNGVASTLRDKASLRLAFGAATWPHQLVRVMLLEQIYRAVSILAGHPYHRE